MTTRGKIQYDVTADTAKFTSQMQKVNNRLGGMQSMLKGMVGTLAGVFAVGQVINFGKELFKIAETSVEVQNAFDRLNDATLLDRLRRATQGAVSDLDLMKKAVSANNLGIPLEQMATLFEFAAKRAAETGENVDHLVTSIVTGIGRKSALVLDNLGIILSTAGKTTAEVADEVTKLAEVALKKMGDVGVNSADQLAASFANMQKNLGEFLLGPGSSFTIWLSEIFDKINDLFDQLKAAEIEDAFTALKDAQDAFTSSSALRGEANLSLFGGAFTIKDDLNALIDALRIAEKELADLEFAADGARIKIKQVFDPDSGGDDGDPVINSVSSGPTLGESKGERFGAMAVRIREWVAEQKELNVQIEKMVNLFELSDEKAEEFKAELKETQDEIDNLSLGAIAMQGAFNGVMDALIFGFDDFGKIIRSVLASIAKELLTIGLLKAVITGNPIQVGKTLAGLGIIAALSATNKENKLRGQDILGSTTATQRRNINLGST